jgi:diamine N-acetyltransferase
MHAAAISLRPITRENFDAIFQLRLVDVPVTFVEANMVSIAEAYVRPTFHPLAIYADETVVGFTMYGYEDVPGQWSILQLMIDSRYQRRGHGRRAMQQLIPMMIERHEMDEIVLSYVDGNDIAARLYRGLGFVETGEVDSGVHTMRLDVREWRRCTPRAPELPRVSYGAAGIPNSG